MPSKRKKNMRRMRKVQAQRRALEEQHASDPPAKASPGIVCAPPAATSKNAAKTPAPVQIPVAVPIVAPIVKPEPIVEEPVSVPVAEPVPVPVPVEEPFSVPEAEPVPVEVAVPEPEAVVLEQTPAEVEVEVPAPVTEEPPVVEATPAEPPVVEAAIVQEAEPIIPEPEPEPVTEAIPPAEAPAAAAAAPVEIEIQTEENITETTETEQDVPAPCVEIPVVADTVPEAPVEEAEALVTEVKESFADSMVDDFVVTESVSAVDVAMAESAAVQPEMVEVSNTESESMDVMPAEPVAAPAEELVFDTSAEQTCLELLSEEPKLGICDIPCQMHLAVESVQLSSMEMSVEASLNGHIAPEVSIEG
ncbi:magnetosome-associated protein MamJ-like isoform X3 [Cebidichthys violaceus]|uniref:magnetosome-associated protein MamJ-like isoform X3 n=1 Tax=Cebidichthys violaceus TaxID=271503 RepID=UPI0035C9A62A